MKKNATLLISCLFFALNSNAQTFSDDFESYNTTTYLGIQSGPWRTWSSTTGGGAEDVYVITTDNHTSGGSKSIYFSSTSTNGGPQDVVLPFNATPLTTGQLTYSMWLKIPSGKSAYFNFQGNATMGNQYVFECFMRGGFIDLFEGQNAVVSGVYPFDTWFEVSIVANLTSNTWDLLLNSSSLGTWNPLINNVYAIDLFPADDTASFWVDDVSFSYVATVGLNEVLGNNQTVKVYPNPMNDISNVIFNVEKEANVELALYSIDGTLISNTNYGKVSGLQQLSIDMSSYSSGMYFINLTIDGKSSMQKLIKQ
ncbi:MAG: T9SS type A sorting domain-containing protein [Bacteroidia bacterium]|nr:T9SS type A sorting domain-containing protein [Bacteroidia bacterium]